MMKYFISKIEKYDIVGFDVDGTIYDEYDFISQSYIGVAKVIADYTNFDEKNIYCSLCNAWKKYGSSKTDLFQSVYKEFSNKEIPDDFIKKCIEAFRNQPICLTLQEEAKEVFNYLDMKNIKKYIVSDGNIFLQRKKIESLGLKSWFDDEDIFISGDYGNEYQKPSKLIVDVIKSKYSIDNMIYIGDRDVDMNFAKNLGVDFIRMKNWELED